MNHPVCLVFITGTGTGVGKTWFAAHALVDLRDRNVTVAARKPAQSFDGADATTDATVLGAATGEPPGRVCPTHRWYPVAQAPVMAAAALGRPPFTIADLVAETVWPSGVEVAMVEGAGGWRSPLAADGDNSALATALAPDLIVAVADAGLGAINAVRLTVEAGGVKAMMVALNHFDPSDAVHRANRDWLVERDGLTVVTGPAQLAEHLSQRASPANQLPSRPW